MQNLKSNNFFISNRFVFLKEANKPIDPISKIEESADKVVTEAESPEITKKIKTRTHTEL